MKLLKLTSLLSFCFAIFIVGGCKKSYPDDRWPHTNGPLKRLVDHTWVYVDHDNLISYQFDFPAGIAEASIQFYRDGTCKGIFYRESGIFSASNDFRGKWEFVDNDDNIKVTNNNGNYEIWKIHRLTRTGLTISNDSIKYYLK